MNIIIIINIHQQNAMKRRICNLHLKSRIALQFARKSASCLKVYASHFK